jgi:1-acyl-sn-glycerol-3-phosphate acyltransferase
MQTQPSSSPDPKPCSQLIHPEITRLPRLTIWRRLFRRFVIALVRLVVWLFTRARTYGFEHVPRQGPVLVVSNHLGDADLVVGMALSPVQVEALSKAELYDYPVLGKLMDAYGVIWVHRGQPDRHAIRAALDGLRQGRFIAIAPEGRESLTGALEQGTEGAAYLALRAGVPVLPLTFTGTENARIYGNLKRLRRTDVTMTVGAPFRLEELPGRKEAIELGTQNIMRTLAAQLPPEYRGVYASSGTCVDEGQNRGDGER